MADEQQGGRARVFDADRSRFLRPAEVVGDDCDAALGGTEFAGRVERNQQRGPL
jgi:hypothetical protein